MTMMSQLSHVEKETCIQIEFLKFKSALYSSALLMKLFNSSRKLIVQVDCEAEA